MVLPVAIQRLTGFCLHLLEQLNVFLCILTAIWPTSLIPSALNVVQPAVCNGAIAGNKSRTIILYSQRSIGLNELGEIPT